MKKICASMDWAFEKMNERKVVFFRDVISIKIDLTPTYFLQKITDYVWIGMNWVFFEKCLFACRYF